MATTRRWRCAKCNSAEPVGRLFDALLAISESRPPKCDSCHTPHELRMEFELGLDASHPRCVVLDAFVPTHLGTWPDGAGNKVTFYPFLVVVRRLGRGMAVWLPYWHLVEGSHRIMKYGQWAPFMDLHLFEALLLQARDKGYFDIREDFP